MSAQPLTVIVCQLWDFASEDESLGIGRSENAALADAIVHFGDKRPEIIRDRVKRGIVSATYYKRQLG